MKDYACLLVAGSILLSSASAFAGNRAVNISIGSAGGALDTTALQKVRQAVGFAVARGTVDSFIVYSPKIGSPIPIEGGLSACAEAGFKTTEKKFNAFIQELRLIQPKPGTSYNIEPAASCGSDKPVSGVCTMDAKVCPDGSEVGRVPPSCEFAPCPGE
jgi:hypothetical protein